MTPRAVIDPGVLVSALLVAGSPPAQALDARRERRIELVVCDLLVEELGEVLARAKFAGRIGVPSRRAVLALLAQRAERHPDPAPRPGLTTDPGDDYLAALALERRATHLVSGDKGLQSWRPVTPKVVSPR